MEGKGSFFNIVLLLIVAFLTLTLAALAGFVFLGGGGGSKQPSTPTAQVVDTKIPKDDELTSYELYEGKTYFNLKTSEANPNALPIIQVNIQLKHYIKTPKGGSIKDPAAKIELYKDEIREVCGTYFMSLDREEVISPEGKEKVKLELKKRINDLLNKNETYPYPIVYEVVLSEWIVT